MTTEITHEEILDRLADADLAFKEARAREYEIARREAEERILAKKIARDTIAAEAHAAGVSIRQIAMRGLHTKNTPTAKEAIEHGRAFIGYGQRAAELRAAEKPTGPFDWDADQAVLTVTLEGEDFGPYRKFLAQDPEGGEEFRTYQFALNGGALVPSDPDNNATWQHPVVQVMTAMDGVWKRKALEYIEKQGVKAA